MNEDQLAEMNQMAKENQSLTGFLVYLGDDDNSTAIVIIVGINSSGQDVTSSIYCLVARGSGPCPTFCDGASTLIAN